MRSEELAKSTSFSGQSEREQADEEELVQQSPADNITNSTQPIQPTQQTGATQNTTLQAAASQQVAQTNATTIAAPGVPTPENTEYVSAELGDPSWPAHTYEATQSFGTTGLKTRASGAEINSTQWPDNFCINITLRSPTKALTEDYGVIALIGGGFDPYHPDSNVYNECGNFYVFLKKSKEKGVRPGQGEVGFGVQIPDEHADIAGTKIQCQIQPPPSPDAMSGVLLEPGMSQHVTLCYDHLDSKAVILVNDKVVTDVRRGWNSFPREGKVTFFSGSHDTRHIVYPLGEQSTAKNPHAGDDAVLEQFGISPFPEKVLTQADGVVHGFEVTSTVTTTAIPVVASGDASGNATVIPTIGKATPAIANATATATAANAANATTAAANAVTTTTTATDGGVISDILR